MKLNKSLMNVYWLVGIGLTVATAIAAGCGGGSPAKSGFAGNVPGGATDVFGGCTGIYGSYSYGYGCTSVIPFVRPQSRH